MEEMLNYLRDNPRYITALIVTAAILVAACVLGFFIKKYNLLRFMDGWFQKKENRDEPPRKSAETDDAPKESADVKDVKAEEEQNAPISDTEKKESVLTDEKNETQPPKSSKFSEIVRSSNVNFAEEYEEEKKPTPPTVMPGEKEANLNRIDENAYYIAGTWKIVRTGSTYTAELWDFDGILLMRSESYLAASGAIKAVENLRNHVGKNNFKVDVKDGKFYFKLLSPSGRLMCKGEPCDTNDECVRRIEIVKHIASRAEVVRA